MPIDALFTAPLIVAAVFVASALGKLADPRRAALAFDALKVPRPFAQGWIRTAHPWAELLIALCLVVTSGIPAVVTAIITTALAAAYLVLIVRALQSPEPTDCACFGVVGAEQVSGWTVLRNVWLLGLSGGMRVGGPGRTLATAVGGSTSVLTRGGWSRWWRRRR